MRLISRCKRRCRRLAHLSILFLCLPALLWGCGTPGLAAKPEPPPADLAQPCQEPVQLQQLVQKVLQGDVVSAGELMRALRIALGDAGQCARRHDALVEAWPR